MDTFLDRLVVERNELKAKIAKLEPFLSTDTFAGLHKFEQDLLIGQLLAMQEYASILDKRIALHVKG